MKYSREHSHSHLGGTRPQWFFPRRRVRISRSMRRSWMAPSKYATRKAIPCCAALGRSSVPSNMAGCWEIHEVFMKVFNGKIICRWGMFNYHVWLSEGIQCDFSHWLWPAHMLYICFVSYLDTTTVFFTLLYMEYPQLCTSDYPLSAPTFSE